MLVVNPGFENATKFPTVATPTKIISGEVTVLTPADSVVIFTSQMLQKEVEEYKMTEVIYHFHILILVVELI